MTMTGTHRRPIDVAPEPIDYAHCTCGKRIWGEDRIAFAGAWYGHLLAMLDSDPDGEHELAYPW